MSAAAQSQGLNHHGVSIESIGMRQAKVEGRAAPSQGAPDAPLVPDHVRASLAEFGFVASAD